MKYLFISHKYNDWGKKLSNLDHILFNSKESLLVAVNEEIGSDFFKAEFFMASPKVDDAAIFIVDKRDQMESEVVGRAYYVIDPKEKGGDK